jgi:hypothetical protein
VAKITQRVKFSPPSPLIGIGIGGKLLPSWSRAFSQVEVFDRTGLTQLLNI